MRVAYCSFIVCSTRQFELAKKMKDCEGESEGLDTTVMAEHSGVRLGDIAREFDKEA